VQYITFAIDPGKVSGWAVATGPDSVVMSGVAKTAADRKAVCETVLEFWEKAQLPLVVIAEEWTAGGWKNYSSLIGVGKAWGTWIDHIHLCLGVPEQHILRFNPRFWRHNIFTSADLKGLDSNGLKLLACQYTGVKDHNEAEAICMAMVGHSSDKGVEAAETATRRYASK